VAELRAGAPERRWVVAPNAPAQWGEGIPGTHLIRRENGRMLFEIDPAGDDQALLQAALATGPVREFHRVEPSLGEIFRTVLEEDRR
jgi:ABC-2 type transport system ATP-binding protein